MAQATHQTLQAEAEAASINASNRAYCKQYKVYGVDVWADGKWGTVWANDQRYFLRTHKLMESHFVKKTTPRHNHLLAAVIEIGKTIKRNQGNLLYKPDIFSLIMVSENSWKLPVDPNVIHRQHGGHPGFADRWLAWEAKSWDATWWRQNENTMPT